MNIIYKLLGAALVAGAVFLSAFFQPAIDPVKIGILAAAAFLITAFILFMDRIVKNMNGEKLFCLSAGLLAGIIGGSSLNWFLQMIHLDIPGLAPAVYILAIVFFGYTGIQFSNYPGLRVFGGLGIQDKEGSRNKDKILDTSVIIDGRILDIAETNFIEGPFIIPNFVLREIQLISDSPDPIKRNRGRRGLDMLNKLQQHGGVKVKISYLDYAELREVDAKLVKLARETGGKLVTNDFNLNKVAELQGVEVLNLNNLTNALKPVVLPGEDILIDVIKEGKDENQGIGYLEDGTMVVVENGGSLLGKTVRVNVTSIIQTAAGKMIFTRAAGVVEEEGERGGGGGGRGRGGDRGDRGGRGRDRGDRGNRGPDRGDRGDRDRGDRGAPPQDRDGNRADSPDQEFRDREIRAGGGGGGMRRR